MTATVSKSLLLAGLLSLGSGLAIAQDSPDEPRASAVRVIFVTVADDGTTIVDCTGVDCETVDCSGHDRQVSSGTPLRIRRLNEEACATEEITLEESQEFEEAQLEVDDLLLTAAGGPSGDQGPGTTGSGGPDDLDVPFIETDEVNQQQVGDTGDGTPVSPDKPGPPG